MLWMRIRIVESGKKKLGLWIPTILVWPIVIVLMILLSPLALVAYILWPKGRQIVKAGPALLAACWAAHGLQIRVHDDDKQVDIDFR